MELNVLLSPISSSADSTGMFFYYKKQLRSRIGFRQPALEIPYRLPSFQVADPTEKAVL
ncbi:hypothetical protein O3689_01345 [Prevotella nigrescens]|uniref:hypothetical protein n=1 Tax=Prevotella nigrescens TaxID=28133 RepID=UPI0028E377BB|nr:hypothetical protein [Prevotella nigrescens]